MSELCAAFAPVCQDFYVATTDADILTEQVCDVLLRSYCCVEDSLAFEIAVDCISLHKHLKHCASTYKIFKVTEAWVLHFSKDPPLDNNWPDSSLETRVAHIQYEATWERAYITFDDARDKQLLVEFSTKKI
jgi:hypothetical protein